MRGITKKRGILVAILLFFAILLLQTVSASICINPASSSFCSDVDAAICCPTSGVYDAPGVEDFLPDTEGQCLTSFTAETELNECSTFGYCFGATSNLKQCDQTLQEALCEYQGGAFNTALDPNVCTSGCCIYDDGPTEVKEVTAKQFCTNEAGDFNPAITDPTACALSSSTTTAITQCNDTIDNDGDGLIDFGADSDCESAEDNDESTPSLVCSNGLDDDGDGFTDLEDTCCDLNPQIADESWCLPQTATCPLEIQLTNTCVCDNTGAGEACGASQYCCGDSPGLGTCQSDPCDAGACVEGQTPQFCGTIPHPTDLTLGVCYQYQECELDAMGVWNWGECPTDDTSTCSSSPEVCDSNILNDEDGDGLFNCEDLTCFGQKCGNIPANTDTDAAATNVPTCKNTAGEFLGTQFNPGNSVTPYYVCCNQPTRDCNGDHIPETCGACNCAAGDDPNLPSPEQIDVSFTQGEKQLTVEWFMSCGVDFFIRRCNVDTDATTDCPDPATIAEVDMESFYHTLAGPLQNTREFIDWSIEPNEEYFYVVESIFNNGISTYSDPFHILNSGDALCQQVSSVEFCIAGDYLPEIDQDIWEPQLGNAWQTACDDQNMLNPFNNCRANGDNAYCVGPDEQEGTACQFQSNCAECSSPFGMFAYIEVFFNSGTCDPTCYYDFSETNVDTFQECIDVNACSDYRSESACTLQTDAFASNNKCLTRNCEWQDLTTTLATGVQTGICKEANDNFLQCETCNDAQGNGLFEACTINRCRQYGDMCYLNYLNDCAEGDDLGCTVYTTSNECAPSGNVVVDVGTSTSTNAIISGSGDILGFDTCYWHSAALTPCFKDANGDGQPDPFPLDKTPPTTTVLSAPKLADPIITFLAQDLEPSGAQGEGVRTTFYCIVDAGYCYPDKIAEPLGDGIKTVELESLGGGSHTINYFSDDNSDNLEVVKSFTFAVDNVGPQIIINENIVWDTSAYTNSIITFEILLDEEAYCTDTFDGAPGQMNSEFNSNFVKSYNGLTDGFYQYHVECVDVLGNENDAYLTVYVNADQMVFDPLPAIYADYQPVELSIKTQEDILCGFKANQDATAIAQLDENFVSQPESNYYVHTRLTGPYELTENGNNYFTVLCDVPSESRIARDEIQFVFDDSHPITSVVDMHGQPFDFAAFYTGLSADLYLQCNDPPEGGFGCEETKYCMGASTCDPTITYTEGDVLDVATAMAAAPGNRLDLCFQSFENQIDGMGDLVEPRQCVELKVDQYSPTLTVDPPLQDGYVIYLPVLTITGSMNDPDALSGEPINTVTIAVTNTNGETTITNTSSNPTFSTTVTGFTASSTNETEYNTVAIYGRDRSGATTAQEVYNVVLATDFPGGAIQLIEPPYGVSSTSVFDFTVETFLNADGCRWSMNNDSYEYSVPFAPVGILGNTFTQLFEIVMEEVPHFAYVRCELENGQIYLQKFMLMWDSTPPAILDAEITNSDGKTPPMIVQAPLEAVLEVETDDPTQCKFGTASEQRFSTGMQEFDDFDDGFKKTNIHTFTVADLQSYTYYVQCRNGALMTSPVQPISFSVDLSAAPDIILDMEDKTAQTTFSIPIRTTKRAMDCSYRGNESEVEEPMQMTDNHHFQTSSLTFTEGVYQYYFTCSFAEGLSTDYYDITVDTTPPVIHHINDSDVHASNTTLYAKWNATDDLTDIVYYNYSIGSSPHYVDVLNWTGGTDDEASIEGLNLQNNSIYYWTITATNEVGLTSTPTFSDGVRINVGYAGSPLPPPNGTVTHCTDGTENEDETDVDCGGSDCGACLTGQACEQNEDCVSLSCIANVCEAPTCSDIIKNQHESDVDCGGGVCLSCELGQTCILNSDCTTAYCSSGICETPSCFDNVQNGNEVGVDCGGSCGECVDVVAGPGAPTCSDNLKNQGEEGIDCGGPCLSTCEDKGSSIWFWLSLIIFLIVAGIGGFLLYQKYSPKPVGGSTTAFSPIKSLFGKSKTQPKGLGKGMQEFMQKKAQQMRFARKNAKDRSKVMRDKQKKTMFGAFDEPNKGKDKNGKDSIAPLPSKRPSIPKLNEVKKGDKKPLLAAAPTIEKKEESNKPKSALDVLEEMTNKRAKKGKKGKTTKSSKAKGKTTTKKRASTKAKEKSALDDLSKISKKSSSSALDDLSSLIERSKKK
jgi:hypothetical protein